MSDLEDAHRCGEKELFLVFACLGACEQGAFDLICSSFVQISDLIILNISISQIWKILKDVLKRSFFRVLLAWASVNKEYLTNFAQVLYISLNQSFSIYQCLGIRKCLQMC